MGSVEQEVKDELELLDRKREGNPPTSKAERQTRPQHTRSREQARLNKKRDISSEDLVKLLNMSVIVRMFKWKPAELAQGHVNLSQSRQSASER